MIDVAAISHEISSSQKNRKPYLRWTDKDRYSIGKYTSEHWNTAAVRKFKSNRGGVINTTIANATANALIKQISGVTGDIDVNLSHWVASIFRRMGFVKGRKTSSKVDISDGARKEIEFLCQHDILSCVEELNIPETLIINIDQTPLKYVPVSKETMAGRNSTSVTIEGSDDK